LSALVGPSWVFGRHVPGFELLAGPKPTMTPFSSNGWMYGLIRPNNTLFPPNGGFVDVQDVAKAHILALSSKSSTQKGVGRKRYVLLATESVSYKDALEWIRSERPELKDRVPNVEAPVYPLDPVIERQGLEDNVGFRTAEYKCWKESVLESVDSIVKIEKYWKDAGHDVVFPDISPV
jgi:nucleoside-diphosphate-sugar epimerase